MNETAWKHQHVRRLGLAAIALVVAAMFFALGGLTRLLMGPVSLGPFAGTLGNAISSALPGLTIRFDRAALQWSRDEDRVNLRIVGARVFDRSQRIIAQAPEAEVDLAAGPLLTGKIVVQQIALVGVQLTLVHTVDGALHLGVEGDRGQSDVIERLRQALLSSGSGSSLKSFAVRQARLAFLDERTGLFVVAPQASLQISKDSSRANSGTIVAAVDADIEISGHRAHLVADLKLPGNAQTVDGDVSITGLDINALGENAKALVFLKPYALKADITGSFVLDRGSTRLRYADFGIGATGLVSGLKRPVHVKSLRLVGRYDGLTGRLLIDDGTLAGTEARAHLTGSGNLAFNSAGGLEKGSVDLTLDKIAVNMPGVMERATTLTRIALRASYTPASGEIAINKLLVSGGPLSAQLSGDVMLSPGQAPAIDVSGRIETMDVRDLLKYWPLQLAQGTREWIDQNVAAGSIGPIVLKTDVAAGALDAAVLPNNAVTLSFPVQNATITFLDGLTPLTEVDGDCTLSGNSFTADVDSAKVGPLAVSGGKVDIPRFDVAASPGDIAAHVDGSLSDVLTLIDMKPLRYPSRFHIGSGDTKGQASIDLKFRVPMVKDLSIDDVGIAITGHVDGLALAVGDHNITGGTADLTIDNSSLRVAGKVQLSGVDLDVAWNEAFKGDDPVTTHITARGVLDDAARERLDFHSGSFLKGPVNVRASLEGHRGDIASASMDMALAPATVTLDLINYRKPPGVAADVHVTVHFVDGAITSEDLALSGPGLMAHGTASFGPKGALQRLDFPVVRAGPKNDFALLMTETPANGLNVAVRGSSVDGTGLGRTDLDAGKSQAAPAPGTEPFRIDAKLDRVALRSGVTLAPFALSVSGAGDRPRTLALSAMLSKTAQLTGDLTDENGERTIHLGTNDAGLLLRGLFGFNSIRGGKLDLTAALSPTPTKAEIADKKPPDYRGKVLIRNFTVVNQPFLTRLFSAGSLGGLSDLLQGKGIEVDQLDAPFSMHAGVLDIHDARASGPSIGITADGYLDRRNNKLALEGALAPLYGLNSVLGAIPLIGDVLVSKKGEGIIGMSYSVSGDADEPKVAVNPLSVLTPGILRRIFEGTPKAPATAAAEAGSGAKSAPTQSSGAEKPDAKPPPASAAPPAASTNPPADPPSPPSKQASDGAPARQAGP